MFCPNCGCTCADGTKFCGNCGAALLNSIPTPQPAHTVAQTAPNAPSYAPRPFSSPITIGEYYSLFPSAAENKRQKTLKILFYISAAILSVLLALAIGFGCYDIYIFYKYLGHIVYGFITTMMLCCVFVFATLYLAKKGIAKRSTGRLFGSILFGFLAGACCSGLGINDVRFNRLFAIGICVLHIAMLVINLKSIKEFKANASSIQ